MITHDVKLVGFDEPLLDPRLIARGLKRAGETVRKEVHDVIHEQHHKTGQLEESAKADPVDKKDMSVTVRFKGFREPPRHERKKDGTKGKQYRRRNAMVAAILNRRKGFYDKYEEEIGEEASQAFMKEIKKRKR
jgi:hypothetical protein